MGRAVLLAVVLVLVQVSAATSLTAQTTDFPLNITYPTDGSVVTELVPTFVWESIPGANSYFVCLKELGSSPEGVWARLGVAGDATSIVYNDDGSARQPQLTPGSRYWLRVCTCCVNAGGWGTTVEFSVASRPIVRPDWQSPLRNGTSVSSPAGPYQRGRTIPVKFRLLNEAGQPVSDAEARAMVARLQVFYEKPSGAGTAIDPGDTPPDFDGTFRYQDGQFQYNLSTKDAAWLADYTYGLDLLINGVKAGEVFFSLK